MLKKLFPVLGLLLGTGGGIGAAVLTAPAPEASKAAGDAAQSAGAAHDPAEKNTEAAHADYPAANPGKADHDTEKASEFYKINNQFVIPVMKGERVGSVVVVTLSLEIEPGLSETVHSREPKLRDAFLRVFFDHANMGGFSGVFTRVETLDLLRGALREAARKSLGPALLDVLITDIVRKDA